MRSIALPISLCCLRVPAFAPASARADEPAAAAASPSDHPERGQRMTDVEARYGAPTTRYPAVGEPPITRWDYPGFVVYFEHDRVLHAVVVSAAG